MALSDVSVCNRSLLRIGLEPIASLSESSARAQTCAALYDGVKTGILSMHPWRFTMVKVQLAELSTAPTNVWANAFQLPSERIAAPNAVYNTTSTGAQPIIGGFEIFGAQLFTNENTVVIDYQQNIAEANWPPYFTPLVEFALAAALGPSLTDRGDLTEEYHARAWGTPQENYRGGWFAIASFQDAKINPAPAMDTSELTNARFS